MGDFSQNTAELFLAVLRMSWQASVLALLILLTIAAFRSWLAPRYRHALWLLLVVRLLLPTVPASPTSVLNVIEWPFRTVAAEPEQTLAVSIGETIDGRTAAAAEPGEARRASTASSNSIDVVAISFAAVVWTWFSVAAFLLMRTLVQSVGFRRRLRVSSSPAPQELEALLAECCGMLRLRGRPALVLTDAISSPAVMGVFRPRVLIPPEVVRGCSSDELRMVLLHELAHVRRFDVAVNWIVTLLRIVHWFNPLLHYAFRRMQVEREMACDEIVLDAIAPGRERDYGLALLHIVELTAARSDRLAPLPAGMAGLVRMAERRLNLEERILMIAQGRRRIQRRHAIAAVSLAVLLAFAGLTRATDGEAELPVEERPVVHEGSRDFLVKTYLVADLIGDVPSDKDLARAMDLLASGLTTDRCECELCLQERKVANNLDQRSLVIRETAEGHERIKAALEGIRDGSALIQVECIIATGPADVMRNAYEFPVTMADTGEIGTALIPVQLFPEGVPAKARVVNEAELIGIRKTLHASDDTNLLFTPKLTVLSGKEAGVSSLDGLTPIASDGSRGLIIRMTPKLNAKGRIQFSTHVSIHGDSGPPVIIGKKVMRVSKGIRAAAEIACGETLVIGGFDNPASEDGKDHTILMLTARRAEEREDLSKRGATSK